jgi:hypothetical protein
MGDDAGHLQAHRDRENNTKKIENKFIFSRLVLFYFISLKYKL